MNESSIAKYARLALALIFLFAAPQKILAPADFAASIATYQILPDMAVNFTALILPWLEIIVAILLVCRAWTGPALFLANTMLAVFLGALASAYLRGLDLSCGCFSSAPGASADMIWYMVRDGVFLVIGLVAALTYRAAVKAYRQSLPPEPEPAGTDEDTPATDEAEAQASAS